MYRRHLCKCDRHCVVVNDNQFIARTSRKEICGDRDSRSGVAYDIDANKVGYIITRPNKEIEITYFKPETKIKGLSSFTKLIRTFKQTCSKHKNYNYYNLSRDIMEDVTTENEGPIKEIVINGNNMGTRMYYYKNKEAVVKVGTASVVLRRGRDKYDSSIKFENVNDFTAFVEGIIPYCTANNLNFNNDINRNDMLQHFELQKKITHRGKFLNNAKVLATSFCYPGNAALAYYDNKTTMLITVEKFMKDFVGGSDVPVKLDEDLQTAEEFQNWVSDHVNPYCQEHKIGYFKFVKRLNKQYDEKHKDDLLALQLDEAQIELVNREYDKSISDVGMNAKPNHDNDHKLDDTGIVGKILSQLENDKQLDRLAGTPNNKENGGRQ